MNEAREFAEKVAALMRSELEKGKEAMPVCFARRSTGETMIIGFEFPEGDGGQAKDSAALAMRILADDPVIDYVVFLSDAWMATMKPEEWKEEEFTSVRELAGRQEAIIASIFGRNRIAELGHWVYERKDGKLDFPKPMKWIVPEHCEGRFMPETTSTRSKQ